MIATTKIDDSLEETMPTASQPHEPVLLNETLALLRLEGDALVVDATLGAGGHAEALLKSLGDGARMIGIDRDPAAVEIASRRLAGFGDRFRAIHGDYRAMVELLRGLGIFTVDGIVADLGVSSMQLDDPARGFAFRQDGPLDMRMDPERGRTAAELLAEASQEELELILRTYGEEKQASRIARALIREREHEPLRTTSQLAQVVESALGSYGRKFRIHPATRTFQALRIAVNDELTGLARFVADAVSLLRPGARMAVISFHSLEDRAVKHEFRALAERCICPPGLPVCGCGRQNVVRILTSRPVRPGAEELEVNPRARSARLRAVERL